MRYVALTRGEVAIVDDEDYEWISRNSWFYSGRYAQRLIELPSGRKKTLLMHRAIMQPPRHMQVDHINGNTLDNRRANLRLATKSQNQANSNKTLRSKTTSRYKGVSYNTRRTGSVVYSYWRARIMVDGKPVFLGSFKSEEEAARAYDKSARRLYGAYAKLNFVD